MAKKQRGSVSKIENLRRRIAVFSDWHKVVFPFNRLNKGLQTLQLRRGPKIYVRSVFSVDPYIAMLIFWLNEYHLEDIALPPNATVVDLGANIGMFTADIHQKFPTAKITSYEPHPETFKILQLNAPYATLEQKAAAGKNGTVQFSDVGAPTGLHVVDEGGITVMTESLDEILKNLPHVDLLKVDIEGSEHDLLENASEATFKKIDRIIMEIHPPLTLEWGEKFLQTKGYKTRWIDTEELIYAER